MQLSSLLCAALGTVATNALPTITALGNKFFDSDGKQFFMKGTKFCSKIRSLITANKVQAWLTS